MIRNSLIFIATNVLFLSTTYAEERIKSPFYIISPNLESTLTKETPAQLTSSGYVYNSSDDGLAVSVKGVIVDSNALSAPIKHIDLSQTTSIAISDEGPWQPLFALDKNSSWTRLDYPKDAQRFKLILPEKDDDFSHQHLHASQAEIIASAQKFDWGVDDRKRWISLAEKCDGKSEENPCYSYVSKQKLRLTLANDEVVFLTIEYPGGC